MVAGVHAANHAVEEDQRAQVLIGDEELLVELRLPGVGHRLELCPREDGNDAGTEDIPHGEVVLCIAHARHVGKAVGRDVGHALEDAQLAHVEIDGGVAREGLPFLFRHRNDVVADPAAPFLVVHGPDRDEGRLAQRVDVDAHLLFDAVHRLFALNEEALVVLHVPVVGHQRAGDAGVDRGLVAVAGQGERRGNQLGNGALGRGSDHKAGTEIVPHAAAAEPPDALAVGRIGEVGAALDARVVGPAALERGFQSEGRALHVLGEGQRPRLGEKIGRGIAEPESSLRLGTRALAFGNGKEGGGLDGLIESHDDVGGVGDILRAVGRRDGKDLHLFGLRLGVACREGEDVVLAHLGVVLRADRLIGAVGAAAAANDHLIFRLRVEGAVGPVDEARLVGAVVLHHRHRRARVLSREGHVVVLGHGGVAQGLEAVGEHPLIEVHRHGRGDRHTGGAVRGPGRSHLHVEDEAAGCFAGGAFIETGPGVFGGLRSVIIACVLSRVLMAGVLNDSRVFFNFARVLRPDAAVGLDDDAGILVPVGRIAGAGSRRAGQREGEQKGRKKGKASVGHGVTFQRAGGGMDGAAGKDAAEVRHRAAGQQKGRGYCAMPLLSASPKNGFPADRFGADIGT